MGVDISRSTPSAPGGAGILDRMQGEASSIGGGIASGVGGVIGGIGRALQGITQGGAFSEVDEASKQIIDGQEALNDQTELLSPLMDYGSASMAAGEPASGTGFLPFRRQIGPMRNVSIHEGNSSGAWGLRLHDRGLWDLRLHATASWTATFPVLGISLNVYTPSGALYSTQKSQMNPGLGALTVRSETTTMNIISSVVIPEPDYYVLAYVDRAAPLRGWLGGPAWSRLTAQHISREVDGNWYTGSENSDDAEDPD